MECLAINNAIAFFAIGVIYQKAIERIFTSDRANLHQECEQ
ncbi:MAG: hypothetical protein AAGA60_12295 [Cyanobacteria bacterium P01_E01_bin.42]